MPAALVDAMEAPHARRAIEDTWGHLAPRKNKKYAGKIVFTCDAYHGGRRIIIVSEFEDLGSSPRFYASIHEWLEAQPMGDGVVYMWIGFMRNYKFEGQTGELYRNE